MATPTSPWRFKEVRPGLYILLACLAVFPSQAWAYIDPGTNSFLIQVFFSAFLTISVTLRMFWQRVKDTLSSFLRGRKTPEKK